MVLLLGGNGSIGKRYQAILRYLDEPFFVYDSPAYPHGIHEWEFDRAIIATPTWNHGMYCRLLSQLKKPFLCEKPLSMDLKEAKELSETCDGFVVNNYQFAIQHLTEPIKKISYDFFNTGKDGLIWDVCQLVQLAHKFKAKLEVRKFSPFWNLQINFERLLYRYIEWSYASMIRSFLKNEIENLWDLKTGYEMSLLCAELESRTEGDYEAFNWCPSEDKFSTVSKKNLSIHRTESSS